MEKMILTATSANSWIHPDVKNWPNPESVDELVNCAVECYEAGATIYHVHLPRDERAFDIVNGIRDKCDIIIQAGMSSFPIEQRPNDFKSKPDMLSIILNHHDEHFAQMNVNQLHTLEEYKAYAKKCAEFGIEPEFEIWHSGSWWNLKWLIDKGLLTPPHVCTLFFDWPGGTWSPATPDSYLFRVKYMPENVAHTVSIMSEKQITIATLAIVNGGNVRVGTEDYPFITPDKPAKNNPEIVKRMVALSREMDREVATPSEARKILKLK
ncbi:MAG: 3-keto-5-aminohexanoate cleavage protein [Promethearchaeota archaeon]